MTTLRRFVRRLTSWATAARDEDRLRSEIDEHIAMQTEENLRAGLSPGEARRQARLKFGSVETIKATYRDQRGLPFIEMLVSDTRHALRRMRRAPAFTAAVVVTLALGIGANTAIFGVIESVLIRPLSYPDPEALVGVWHTAPGMSAASPVQNCSPSMYFTYREENRTFQQFGVWRFGVAPVTGAGEPELPRVLMVTHGVLDALDVKPMLGRWFSQPDDTPGSPDTVILTHGYWRRRFLGDASVIGRAMTINARPHTVIGVMPEAFTFSRDRREPELILPLRFERSKVDLGTFAFRGIARLKPGVTMARANADLARMLGVWLGSWPPPPGIDRGVFLNARFGPQVQPLKQEIVGNVGAMLWVVMGTLAMVLLIACANVASLLLVDTEVRGPELAIRAALGAGWRRIGAQLLAESMTLGVLGGALGLWPAYVGLKILAARGPSTLPRLNEIHFDPWVVAFAFGASLLSGALAGIIPLLKYVRPHAAALRTVGRTFSDTRERHRARNTLVVVQVALALVLLVGAGLMIRTFQQLRAVQPGFTQPEAIHIVRSSIPEDVAPEPGRAMRMWHEILDKLAAIPGVTSVGLAGQVPLEAQLGFRNRQRLNAEASPVDGRARQTSVEMRLIAPSFFKTMGTRLIAGRDFTWSDLYQHRHVAIVSDNLARAWWGGPRAALGQRVRESSIAPWREVVGVAEDVYDDGVDVNAPEFAYLPALMDRHLVFDREFVLRGATFAIRSQRAGTASLMGEARNAIWSVNGRQPVFAFVNTVGQLYDQSMVRTSFTLVILAIVGGVALLLGTVGIYGVIAYTVSQRTREIGVRMALGARPASMLHVFIRQGVLLAVIGVGVGLAAAVGLTRLMSSLLFGVSAVDPLTYAAVSALLMAAAVVASYLPARRAMAIDPVQALRGE
jgi:putative ABC transport system permease protein